MPETPIDPARLGDIPLPRYRTGETQPSGTFRRSEITQLLDAKGEQVGELIKSKSRDGVETVVQQVRGEVQHVIQNTREGNHIASFSVFEGNNDASKDSDRRGKLKKAGTRLQSGAWDIKEGFDKKGVPSHEFRTGVDGRGVVLDTRRKSIETADGKTVETTIVDTRNPGSEAQIKRKETFDRGEHRTSLREEGSENYAGGKRRWETTGTYQITMTGGEGKIIRGIEETDETRTDADRTMRTQRRDVFRNSFDEYGRRQSDYLERTTSNVDTQGQPLGASSTSTSRTETEYVHHKDSTVQQERLTHLTTYRIDANGDKAIILEQDFTHKGGDYATRVTREVSSDKVVRTTNANWNGSGWVNTNPAEASGVRSALARIRAELGGK